MKQVTEGERLFLEGLVETPEISVKERTLIFHVLCLLGDGLISLLFS